MEPAELLSAADRKRKRSAIDSAVDGSVDPGEKLSARPAPLEEEVEEFFAILRRVHSSVKRSGKSSDGNGARTERRTALELYGELSSTPVLVNGGSNGKVSKVVNGAYNRVIDLNTVPEDTAEG